MEKAKISAIQLFVMMFLFEMGSALVVSLGIGAKKDAWVAVLLGMLGGVALFFVYYSLYRHYPTLPFIHYVSKIFGKYLGWVIGLLYIVYWLYSSARNLRDFGDLLLSSSMPKTPLLVLNMLMIVAICYVIYLGVEVIGRTGELLTMILIFFIIIGNLFVYLSGNVDMHNLGPFLENGWKPILKTAYPATTLFPFGEMFAFSMIIPYLNKQELVKKVWLFALLSSGLLLSYTISLNIAVLGVEEVERSTFPLLSTIGKVNLFDFIQRLDAMVVFAFLITMFFKTSIFFYCALIAIVELFKLKEHQQIVFPIGIIILFLSMIIASNFSEHIEEGLNIVPYYLHCNFLIILPLCMLLVAKIRKHFK
ncbi:GerAB/ArcD/ProY family transporter [Bacillus sp. 03113]|uniref:GerAB/ArcD/ProY family transporter n=1 Tax=Bacillus sp. 03113 TaxID=2578211 RepID=UPI0011448AD5|nr:GerAB/ArcD/ProY family transporter [Bacillus sp. 03113]